nr:ORF122 [Acipenserid herpesvirus 1]
MASPIITAYPTFLTSEDDSLTILQMNFRGSKIRFYYNNGSAYVNCHRVIYDIFLAKTVKLATTSKSQLVFCFIDCPNDVAVKQFVMCLYLKHLNIFNRQGALLESYIFDHPLLPALWKLAHTHQLDWLKKVYLYHQTPRQAAYGVCCLKNNNELMCVTPTHIDAMGVPTHLKALTCSPNGETWFALSSPHPRLLKIWVRLPHTNYWTVVTSLTDSKQNSTRFQLCLGPDNAHIYVLKDARRLLCYNVSNKSWHEITTLNIDGVLVETGDGSLPPTVLINNQAHQLLTCVTNPSVQFFWKQPASSSLYQLQTIQPLARVMVLDDEKKVISTSDSAFTTGIYAAIEASIDGDEWKASKLSKSQRVKNKKEELGCPITVNEWKILRQNKLEEGQQWVRVLGVKGSFYAQREDGRWWTVKVSHHNTRMLNGEWIMMEHILPNSHLMWNPKNDALSEVSDVKQQPREFIEMKVDDQVLLVDSFNPLFLDESFLNVSHANGKVVEDKKKGGLCSLYGLKVNSTNEADKLNFQLSPNTICPLALRVFLQHITRDMAARIQEGYDVTFKAGKVCYLEKLNSKTNTAQIELQANNKTRDKHVVLADNLNLFLARYFPSKPTLCLMGSMGTLDNVQKVTEFYDYDTNHCII